MRRHYAKNLSPTILHNLGVCNHAFVQNAARAFGAISNGSKGCGVVSQKRVQRRGVRCQRLHVESHFLLIDPSLLQGLNVKAKRLI